MDTPIVKFVEDYKNSGIARFHMPGHKGVSFFGPEALDITEIRGADDLSCPEGIILKSEENAAGLFGTCRTLYSTGGSTQSIHAMLYLAFLRAEGEEPYILAGRNAHKAFIYAVAKLGVRVKWLYPEKVDGICGCAVSPESLEQAILEEGEKPFGVYITSPDYLGGVADIRGLSEVTKKYHIPLLVDNAHGAYSAFAEPSFHPIHLGADICCDSAHKTLPCLTGTGYLHIAEGDAYGFSRQAVHAMGMFGSTSPSYLLMQSLDLCNVYLEEKIRGDLKSLASKVQDVVSWLDALGIPNHSQEPTKITADLRRFGLTLEEIGAHFRSFGLEFEYADGEFVVFMASPQNQPEDFERLKAAFSALPPLKMTEPLPRPEFPRGKQIMPIRRAVFSPTEEIAVEEAVGRICGAPTVACPPAIPIAVSGEEITEQHVALFRHYGIARVWVVQER